ncbi:MAG: hypothetical protein ACHQ4F_14935, partial [Candidatus Dormibacteria bacterium]
IDRTLALARVDWAPSHRQPTIARLASATMVAIAGSLAADALLVAIGTHVFPTTAGYGHFRFNDYAKLTIIGVLIGAAGWPVVTHISSAPRWVYGWLTILISLALFLPDAWLLVRGQPPRAVAVLMAMHVAIAVVIYCTMVSVAPIRTARHRADRGSPTQAVATPDRAATSPAGRPESR